MVFFKPARERPWACTGPAENFLLERGVMLAQIAVPVQKLCKIHGRLELLKAAHRGGFIRINFEYRIKLGDLQQVANFFRQMQ
jgi:hypothetical protein